jgi:ABC-type multidrug transport system permease subunit
VSSFLHHLGSTLRLYTRNKMALFYSYLFPVIFLVAWVAYYRYDRIPLLYHMGELLTIAVLGGACFGLPTSMVSERERGVWRRYRLAPVPTGTLVASTSVARYFSLLTAGLGQVILAIAMAALIFWQRDNLPASATLGNSIPIPEHPFQLIIAFTFVSFAFIGLGLVIAVLADNVPAVQALGQCIFLPMLIIGGVGVRLSALGPTIQHISAFLPGRYAVEAIQTCYTGAGVLAAENRFNLLALFLIGVAGCITGSKMFRWDAQQKFFQRGGKSWIAIALVAWLAVGVMKERQGGVLVTTPEVGEQGAETTPAATPGPSSGALLPGARGARGPGNLDALKGTPPPSPSP